MKNINFTKQILDFSLFVDKTKIFIETGSAMGDGIKKALHAGFQIIRSVEAKDTYYNNCLEMFNGNNKVKLYFGMSQDKLQEMISDINEPCVFWLDAHVSGPNSAGHEDYLAKGNDSLFAQDNVLMSELDIILKHRNDHIILIDDQSGLNAESEKYINTILKTNNNYKFYFYDEQRQIRYENKCLVCITG